MADNIEIEQRVLDGDLIGPVNAEIDTEDFTGRVAIENSLLDGTGSEISVELSESLGVVGIDDLVEVKAEIDKSVLKAESTVTEAQKQIDKANATIASLNAISTQITNLVGEAKQAASTATNEAADAERSENAAAGSAKAASDSQSAAAGSAKAASDSQSAAAESQAQALASQKAAKTSETNASGSEARTLQSEKNAAASAKEADTDQKAALEAQKAAELARDAAKSSENKSSTYAGNAYSSKTDAETALAAAKKSEAAAAQSAKEAETSASSMTQSVADASAARDAAIAARDRSESARDTSVSQARLATTKASEASSSAAEASSSASAAKTSETNALNSQRAAKTSETNSKTSETNSKASEGVALASKDSAAKSAADANASAADAKKSQDAAKASRDEAEHFAVELRKGSVYRGIWNPNSNKYPDVPPTNSRWDVQLNKGQLEKIFDGKEWNWGDRLIYVLETKSFDIIDSGTGVTSINGETGSVTINRDTLGALGKTEKAADSAKLEGSSKAQIIAKAREGLGASGTSYTKAESDSKYLPKEGKAADSNLIDGIDSSRLVYGYNQYGTTISIDLNTNDKSNFIEMKDAVTTNKPGRATSWVWGWQTSHSYNSDTRRFGAQLVVNQDNQAYYRVQDINGFGTWAHIYSTAFKPTAADVGAYSKSEADGKYFQKEILASRDFAKPDFEPASLPSGNYRENSVSGSLGQVAWFNGSGTSTGGFGVQVGYNYAPRIISYTDTNKTRKVEHILYTNLNKPTLEDVAKTTTTVKNLQLASNTWTTLLGKTDGLTETGVYQILVTYSSYQQGGGAYLQHYTGQFAWYAGNTNSPNTSEIPLHHMGHADSGEYIYLRTQIRMGNKGDQTVDIKCNKSHTKPVAFTVKLVKIM
ncbi:tail protein [Vibrio phage Athena]|uniref:Tail fiber protein n=5 Tax=Thalassavirus TaxID=2948922 RepID=A0A6M9Z2B0_9CAUD|nr:tail protein [Vibrio phage Chester]YP_010108274.1 tail protein [Vibrio phage Cody]YP_010108467.1 tail protein [Vibrio phage Quinn]YP_010108663.1 tail protein [Vibrio phage Athena]YP_010114208.1 tail protein [Vibrio phage Gary]QIG66159.1 tail fiber protein [Vibrio phage Cilsick]QIG66349.1 tail fiber protein [Vibrio phage Chazly21]QKN84505.1 tail fiber protein [Vibrio phage BBMuffin]QQO89674.1 tail fiber protein [Vibrio phage GRLPWR]QQO89872.1 tail fiber protein [Vibrio phage ABurr]WBF69